MEEDRLKLIENKLEGLQGVHDTLKEIQSFMQFCTSTTNQDDTESLEDSETDEISNVPTPQSIAGKVTGISISTSTSDATQVMLPPTTQVTSPSDPTQVAGPSKDLFAERLSAYEKTDSVGPAIKDSLAKFIDHSISNFMDVKLYKELSDKYLRPDNTNNLVAPRCNIEIWKLLSENNKQRDIKIGKHQDKLVKGLIPLVLAMENCKDDTVLTLLTDSFQLLSQANMDINADRKDKLRSDLGKVKHLANKDLAVSNHLFGNDLEAELKKAEVAIKLTDSIKDAKPKSRKRSDHSEPKHSSSKKPRMDAEYFRNKMADFRHGRGGGSSQSSPHTSQQAQRPQNSQYQYTYPKQSRGGKGRGGKRTPH